MTLKASAAALVEPKCSIRLCGVMRHYKHTKKVCTRQRFFAMLIPVVNQQRGNKMSNYESHAKREFHAAGWTDADGKFSDGMQEMMCKHVMKLLEVFADEGHSGSSAPYAVRLFEKLARFEPIVPLSGDDSEWNDVGDGVYQNKRCSHVFKENGIAYDSQGRVFREPNGACFTNRDSRVTVTFPYTPKTEYVDREAS